MTASAKRAGGVEKVQVDLETQTVTVIYDPAKTSAEAIKKALEAGGETVLPARGE